MKYSACKAKSCEICWIMRQKCATWGETPRPMRISKTHLQRCYLICHWWWPLGHAPHSFYLSLSIFLFPRSFSLCAVSAFCFALLTNWKCNLAQVQHCVAYFCARPRLALNVPRPNAWPTSKQAKGQQKSQSDDSLKCPLWRKTYEKICTFSPFPLTHTHVQPAHVLAVSEVACLMHDFAFFVFVCARSDQCPFNFYDLQCAIMVIVLFAWLGVCPIDGGKCLSGLHI